MFKDKLRIMQRLIFAFQIGLGIINLMAVKVVVEATAEAIDSERLIGWRGESYHHHATGSEGGKAESAGRTSSPWIETISWSPRAFLYHGFLTHEECDHMIRIASGRLSRSLVVGGKGRDQVDGARTSQSASLGVGEDSVIRGVEDRIAEWTRLPRSHGEPIEVLRYTDGQKYDAHWDWFDNENETGPSGNRIATVLMYLSEVEPGSGGETALPLALPIDAERQSTAGMSDCATRGSEYFPGRGVAVRPERGAALLFWDMLPDGNGTDRHALHASCPTTTGFKWTATRWIHVGPYGMG